MVRGSALCLVSEHRAARHRIGILAPEVVPAYVGDRPAEDVLSPGTHAITITTAEMPTRRRYATCGEVRAMDDRWSRRPAGVA
ncbi:hypothetical protein [Kitasatospora sp. NPDC002965]|uniref:hypothetical protein n=1 Tax=Kitasatospora sp. NPDC002965 TaxID=3154775 RepID=UPI0033B275CF